MAPRLAGFEWTSDVRLRVMLRDFQLNEMPAAMIERFRDRIRSGVTEKQTRYARADGLTIELVDEQTKEVMDTVTSAPHGGAK